MSAPTVSPALRDHESDDGAGLGPDFASGAGAGRVLGSCGHGEQAHQDHAAAVAEQLLDLAGQIRSWQRSLVSTSAGVAALAAAYPGAAGVPPSPAARAAGARQVRALVTRLAANAGTVTWLCIRTGHETSTAQPGSDDPVAGPLLARFEPVRVLVCAPTIGPARALAAANSSAPTGWLRVARSGGALRGTRADLLVATQADSLTVAPGPDGALWADEVNGVAITTLMCALVDSLWDGALPLASAERIEEVAHEPVKLKILGLLEAGAKDEAIARALSMSLRTCRRHIAELLSAVGAGSRFQAATRFAHAGLLQPGR